LDIRDFPLAWRWTDKRYAVLPETVLAQMKPLEPKQANEIFTFSLGYTGEEGLDKNQFNISAIRTDRISKEEGSRWLNQQQSDPSILVTLSWQPDTAIETNWGIFSTYWTEFCYPASDDLLVWSDSNEWVLLYHHEEEFQFGARS